MINYSPFYKTLLIKKKSQYQLINKYLVSASTLNRIKNNKSVSLKTIEYLCQVLNCEIKDLVIVY